MNIIKELYQKGHTTLGGNRWLVDNIHYITQMGSVAYGVSEESSDTDIYSFCIPPKEDLFPHLKGEIVGFGDAKNTNNRFRNYQQHHILRGDKSYDLAIYNIVDYFQLVMENNSNMIDSLYTPQFCVLHCTKIGQMVRDNRKLFLHLGAWHTFKGYAYSQLKKCTSQNRTGKRKESVEEFGFDVKFAYHIVRNLLEIEQILIEGDLDLQRGREQLKAIRRGEWSLQRIEEFFEAKEKQLELAYSENKANLPRSFNDDGFQARIKTLLIQCLEEHYGALDKVIVNVDKSTIALNKISKIIQEYERVLL